MIVFFCIVVGVSPGWHSPLIGFPFLLGFDLVLEFVGKECCASPGSTLGIILALCSGVTPASVQGSRRY